MSQNRNRMLRQLAINGHAAALVDRAPTKARVYYQGFGPVTILGLFSANIIVQPQMAFKTKRVYIPSDIAGSFLVNDMKVGNISQLPSTNAIPARVFSEVSVDSGVEFDTAQVSMQVSMSITSTSNNTLVYTAAWKGAAVDA